MQCHRSVYIYLALTQSEEEDKGGRVIRIASRMVGFFRAKADASVQIDNVRDTPPALISARSLSQRVFIAIRLINDRRSSQC